MAPNAGDRWLLYNIHVFIVNVGCALILPCAFKLASQSAEEAVEHAKRK
jgi:hypothetical protein